MRRPTKLEANIYPFNPEILTFFEIQYGAAAILDFYSKLILARFGMMVDWCLSSILK